MAAAPWNRVNIPFPSAVSSVRVRFTSTTDVIVKALLGGNENVLKLLRSEILQTEIRVLYELLYILNNSSRGIKTFKGLKQVEQCINRLKNMKLDKALQELADLCPNRIQRGLSITAGECDLPSQPMLEWLCLKVLGAAQLMSQSMNRCSRAFLLSKQQMKWEEFVILNVVISSLLSRLWVFFRGILANLSTLYQQLLVLLEEVALAQPMPFITGFSLPGNMAQFLGPSDAFELTKTQTSSRQAKDQTVKQRRRRKPSVKANSRRRARKVQEDTGVAVERGVEPSALQAGRGGDADMKPFLSIFKSTAKEGEKREMFKRRAREAATFSDMAKSLEESVRWCKSQKMVKEKRLLTFLRLKCQKMKCLEAAGHNVQRKLRALRREVCWAFSPDSSTPKTRQPAPARSDARLRTRLQSLKRRLRLSTVRLDVKGQKRKRRRTKRRSELPASGQSENSRAGRTADETPAQTTDSDDHDDIDDIFASVGL